MSAIHTLCLATDDPPENLLRIWFAGIGLEPEIELLEETGYMYAQAPLIQVGVLDVPTRTQLRYEKVLGFRPTTEIIYSRTPRSSSISEVKEAIIRGTLAFLARTEMDAGLFLDDGFYYVLVRRDGELILNTRYDLWQPDGWLKMVKQPYKMEKLPPAPGGIQEP